MRYLRAALIGFSVGLAVAAIRGHGSFLEIDIPLLVAFFTAMGNS